MKGRTTCPKCKKEFSLEVPDDCKKHDVICPKCKNKFTIQPASKDEKKGEGCYWEEHGEPRKTILSSIKPKTNKPMIAAIILAAVFALGITTAAFSETFIESSAELLSNTGIKGTIELSIIDMYNNESLENVVITINEQTGYTDKNGIYTVENVSLGIKTVDISLSGYKTQKREILVYPFIKSSQEINMEAGDGEENITFDAIGCSIILIIFSVFALVGAVTSFKRQNLDVAAAGALLGIFSFGFLLTGSILSIIAFAIIMMSKEEFEDGKKGKKF